MVSDRNNRKQYVFAMPHFIHRLPFLVNMISNVCEWVLVVLGLNKVKGSRSAASMLQRRIHDVSNVYHRRQLTDSCSWCKEILSMI